MSNSVDPLPSSNGSRASGSWRTFFKEHATAISLAIASAVGGAIVFYLIWMTRSIIEQGAYHSNYEKQLDLHGKVQKLELRLEAQQGKIDTQQKWIGCLEKQVRTGKNHYLNLSTYECIEDSGPAGSGVPPSQPD